MIEGVLSSGIGSGTNRAIGSVIIGGQSLVLLLSLVVTPVAYSLLDDLSRFRVTSWVRSRRAAAAATAAFAIVFALAGAANAQTLQAAPSPVTGEVIHLTAPEAVRMAIANNPDLAAGSYDPGIGAERVAEARAAFLPTVQSSFQRNVQQTPPSSIFFGAEGVRTDLWTGSIGLAQRLPWGGGVYNIGWGSTRTDASSTLSNFNPSVTAQLQAIVSQPLLRDFK